MEPTVIKLILIGDCQVGKTTLMIRYIDQYFSQDSMATIGLNLKEKSIMHNGRPFKVQI